MTEERLERKRASYQAEIDRGRGGSESALGYSLAGCVRIAYGLDATTYLFEQIPSAYIFEDKLVRVHVQQDVGVESGNLGGEYGEPEVTIPVFEFGSELYAPPESPARLEVLPEEVYWELVRIVEFRRNLLAVDLNVTVDFEDHLKGIIEALSSIFCRRDPLATTEQLPIPVMEFNWGGIRYVIRLYTEIEDRPGFEILYYEVIQDKWARAGIYGIRGGFPIRLSLYRALLLQWSRFCEEERDALDLFGNESDEGRLREIKRILDLIDGILLELSYKEPRGSMIRKLCVDIVDRSPNEFSGFSVQLPVGQRVNIYAMQSKGGFSGKKDFAGFDIQESAKVPNILIMSDNEVPFSRETCRFFGLPTNSLINSAKLAFPLLFCYERSTSRPSKVFPLLGYVAENIADLLK